MVASPLPTESPQGNRRLAAVWFADIVGYSSLASQDEREALAQVRAFQNTCLTAIERHGGRLVKFIGDAAFAEFASTESALRAAIALATAFGLRDPASPGTNQLRIGIHVGDVVAAADGDIYGDGINLAARLQREARPGQILVSGDVRRQLAANRAFSFRAIGSRDLRGMNHQVEIFAVAFAASPPATGRAALSPTFLFRELRRRYVFRAAALYLIVAWSVIQVAATIGPPLGLPAWTTRLVIVLATLGFPIALVLAWAFEMTPDGIARTSAAQIDRTTSVEDERVERDGRYQATNGSVQSLSVAPDTSSFVGRDEELRRIESLLALPECRLITITGPGGIGKTRLATQVGTLCASRFEEGAWVVPLAGQESASAVLPAIAEQFRLPLVPGTDTKAQLIDFLREKEVLVVIDNFEQFTDSAALLAEILAEASRAKFLVTSRERLNLRLERVISLQGLECGGGSEDSNEARRLFVQSARRVVPDFDPGTSECEAIEALCRAVEGIPLAIELAAGWTRVLPCQEILNEMRVDTDFLASEQKDVPERHRSLHAVFESSWRLLTEEERRAFRRLSVFVGSFDREAAASVTGVTIGQLSSLLDQSLLRREPEGRFRMLEVLRQYAAEKLAEDVQEDEWARGKFASYYLDFLERLQPRLRGPAGEESLGRIATELENVRRAWTLTATDGRAADFDRALEPLFTFFSVRGRVREGEELLSLARKRIDALGSSGLGGDTALVLARMRIRSGVFRSHLGRYGEARAELEAGLSAVRRLGNSVESAFALENLGRIAFNRGEYDRARELHLESQDLYRGSGDQGGSGRASIFLGNLAYTAGDYAEANRLYSESVTLLRGASDRSGVATSLCNLGVLASTSGDYAGAERLLLESLAIARELDNRRGVASALQTLGGNAVLAGKLQQAEGYLRESIDISREMGFRRNIAGALNMLGRVYLDSHRDVDATDAFREALELGADLGEAPLILETLVGFARLWIERDPARALELLTYVLGHPATDQPSREVAEPIAARIAGTLPEHEAESAAIAGRALDLELAVATCHVA